MRRGSGHLLLYLSRGLFSMFLDDFRREGGQKNLTSLTFFDFTYRPPYVFFQGTQAQNKRI